MAHLESIKPVFQKYNKFLKLLEYLKIAFPVENNNYFLPSALSLKPPVDDSPFPMSCVPLVFTWNKQFLPHGFFLTFVVELLQKSTENHYFELMVSLCVTSNDSKA